MDFTIEKRPIEVSCVEIIEKSLPKITIRLTISSGGYVRSFAPIIADFFGIPDGGCITYLHREKVGNIDLSSAMEFENLDLSNTILYSRLFDKIPEYHLDLRYKKNLIDGLVIDIGNPEQRNSKEEILIYCDDICSL